VPISSYIHQKYEEANMARRIVTVFGASGFLGRHVVRRLAASGAVVRAVVRDVEKASFLKPMGDVGQVVTMAANIADSRAVARAVQGADMVINLVGLLFESGKQNFARLHVEGAANVASAAKAAGVAKLIHVSALGADANSSSAYATSKAKGEEAVRAAFPEAIIFRPSVIFGPEDNFFNRFAGMVRWSPFLPVICGDCPKVELVDFMPKIDLLGKGGPKFQPVYVEDVADAIIGTSAKPGTTYELVGPSVMSMQNVMEMVLAATKRDRLILPIPFPLARLQAFFLQFLPNPVLTPDQVKLLQTDNVASGKLPGLKDLGVCPTPAEAVVPAYLTRFRSALVLAQATRR
jgi:uncharacterized protein YbjT (DUF2867 family)